jgi:GNAT superfamily N-acetyltransferase
MTLACQPVHEVGRDAVRRWAAELDAWLLPDAFYSVQHTWPQLYRSDGEGRFFVLTDGDRLLSHCATRVVTVHGEHGPQRVCLLGSVVTDPALRGHGLASQVLAQALLANGADCVATLLWAERGGLYARAGFVPGAEEQCLVLARRPHSCRDGVRLATVDDQHALHALHARKPWRVERSASTMATLLSTPGMTTLVLERGGAIVAYACCGKGADLQGHWHELGGDDDALAVLLPAALHECNQTTAMLLLPPYRPDLPARLGRHVVDETTVPGPMLRTTGASIGAFWIDGLDSV